MVLFTRHPAAPLEAQGNVADVFFFLTTTDQDPNDRCEDEKDAAEHDTPFPVLEPAAAVVVLDRTVVLGLFGRGIFGGVQLAIVSTDFYSVLCVVDNKPIEQFLRFARVFLRERDE